jgi:hypothetical protein
MQILIIAALFILIGVYSIIDVILSLLQGILDLNLCVCCLFVGIGMMRGRESSRIWGRIWSGFFVMMFLIGIILIAIHDPSMAYNVRWVGNLGAVHDKFLAIAMSSLLLLVPLWIFFTLSVSKYRNNPFIRRHG